MSRTHIDIRSLARSYSASAIRALHGICTDKHCPPMARVTAATAILDRGWGKPQTNTELTVRRVLAREMTDDELAAIAAGAAPLLELQAADVPEPETGDESET